MKSLLIKPISVDEAQEFIRENTYEFPSVFSPLEESHGRIIREELFADRNFPPFHRVCMDGVAISLASWQRGCRNFTVQDFQGAGEAAKTLSSENACIEVMTGAVLPKGCDCVIRFEDLSIENGIAILATNLELREMQNIHQEGVDYKAGDRLLSRGERILAPLSAVAASVGKALLSVSKSPKIAVIGTGDECVPIHETPKSYQIRRSNSSCLQSALLSCGFTRVSIFHLDDDKEKMLPCVEKILEDFDCLIFTGGVSKGKLDYVPHVLKELNVAEIFHGVRQRPGKPLWFGVGSRKQLVFGLPGNPVSALVCAHRYILPALKAAQGGIARSLPYGELTEDFQFNPSLAFFLPVQVEYTNDARIQVSPREVNGSGDFASLVKSDGFIELPEKKKLFLKGEAYPLRFWNRLS
jgi:molybdopterin molybdotransferase